MPWRGSRLSAPSTFTTPSTSSNLVAWQSPASSRKLFTSRLHHTSFRRARGLNSTQRRRSCKSWPPPLGVGREAGCLIGVPSDDTRQNPTTPVRLARSKCPFWSSYSNSRRMYKDVLSENSPKRQGVSAFGAWRQDINSRWRSGGGGERSCRPLKSLLPHIFPESVNSERPETLLQRVQDPCSGGPAKTPMSADTRFVDFLQ